MKKLILLATIFMMVIPSNAQVTFDDDEKNQQESPFANGGFKFVSSGEAIKSI